MPVVAVVVVRESVFKTNKKMGHKEVASLAAMGSLSVTAVAYYLASRPKGIVPNKSTIRKLVVKQPDADLEKVKMVVEEVSMPKVEYGQVLVKMEAVPVVRVLSLSSMKGGCPSQISLQRKGNHLQYPHRISF